MREHQQPVAYAAPRAKAPLEKSTLHLDPLGDQEVLLQVQACGICHSDVHLVDNDWEISSYPLIPGHEIIGKVLAKGRGVPDKLQLGAIVGVGWQRSACGWCEDCLSGRDNMCDFSEATCVGHPGGFAEVHQTDWRYCFPMPEELREPSAAPLLCGGATVYSPLRSFVSRRSARIGVVGLGGLGHLAVKMAAAMGHEVIVFSTRPEKKTEAVAMGAHELVSSRDENEIRKLKKTLDLVLTTANASLPWEAYLSTLRSDGTLCMVGLPPGEVRIDPGLLLQKRRRVAASPIGSRIEIEEMLEFCARHRITATTEQRSFESINEALDRTRNSEAHYRVVLTW